MVGTVDVLLGNLEDAVKADRKEAARAGLVEIAKATDFGEHTQLWTRVNALDSPWALDDLTTLVTEIGDKLDVVMVPKVAGRRGHPLRRPAARPARGQGRPDPADPRPRHPRDRPRHGQRRGDLRRQPAHAGPLARSGRPRRRPPDEDDPRRRRPPRLPRAPGPAGRRRARSTRPARDLPAGPVALHDRPHGRRLRDARDLPVLRPVRRHQGRRRLRGPVPQRLPPRLRRHVVAAPGADRDRQAGLQPRRPRTSRTRAASSRPWATAPAR